MRTTALQRAANSYDEKLFQSGDGKYHFNRDSNFEVGSNVYIFFDNICILKYISSIVIKSCTLVQRKEEIRMMMVDVFEV